MIPHSVSFCFDSFKEFRVFPYIVTYAKKSGFHPFVFQNCQHLWSHLRHATIIKRQIDYFSVCFLPPSNPSVTHLHPSRYLIFQHTIYPLYQPNFTIFYKDSANRKQNKINLFIFYAEVQPILATGKDNTIQTSEKYEVYFNIFHSECSLSYQKIVQNCD